MSTNEAFVELQAIIAGLPMHAVPAVGLRACGVDLVTQCAGTRHRPADPEATATDETACKQRIEVALEKACAAYPSHQDVLSRLDVAFASIDMVILVDHQEGHLFTAARGTDRSVNPLTFPRDWNNNLSIIFGMGPRRHVHATDPYTRVRRDYETYNSYASGHSLGGAVMLHLAKSVEADCTLRFHRVDVFNSATSPLTGVRLLTTSTDIRLHRVNGDWASWGLLTRSGVCGEIHTHPAREGVLDKHLLVHFLPEKAVPGGGAVDSSAPSTSTAPELGGPRWMWLPAVVEAMGTCVGTRSKRYPPGPTASACASDSAGTAGSISSGGCLEESLVPAPVPAPAPTRFHGLAGGVGAEATAASESEEGSGAQAQASAAAAAKADETASRKEEAVNFLMPTALLPVAEPLSIEASVASPRRPAGDIVDVACPAADAAGGENTASAIATKVSVAEVGQDAGSGDGLEASFQNGAVADEVENGTGCRGAGAGSNIL